MTPEIDQPKQAILLADTERLPKEQADQEASESARNEEASEAKSQQGQQENLDRFSRILTASGVDFIESISSSGATLTITLRNNWHAESEQVRLPASRDLWKIWASIASPGDTDKARISLVDLNGNEVGGSRFLAGSSIWVKED